MGRLTSEGLLTFAGRIPPELDQSEREVRLAKLSEEVVAEWQKLEKRLPKTLLAAVGKGLADGGQDLAKDAAKGLAATAFGIGLGAAGAAVAGLTLPMVLTALAPVGVPVVFALVGTAFRWRRTNDEPGPYRLLTRLQQAGGLQLAVPRPYRPLTASS